MTYDPFLIAPYRIGLDLDLEPWLLPQDGFASIRNAHIKHGFIEKRSGYRILAETNETDGNYAISGISTTSSPNPGVVTITSTTASGNAANIVEDARVQINYVQGMTEVNGVEFIAKNVTGTTFELYDLNENPVPTSTYGAYTMGGYVSVFPSNRIMGIGRCYDSSGNRDTIVWDTERGYYFNKTYDSLEPLDLDDIFDSGDEDYVTWANWSSVASTAASPLNRIYFTNGKEYSAGLNGVRFYSCATTPTAPIAASASLFRPFINGANTIDGAQFIFALRQRLILLGTVEGATSYPQRARWCQARNPGTPPFMSSDTEWDDNVPGLGGFVDAPTSEHIVSARFLQDAIIVLFTNSIWALQPSADPRLPFRWVKINSFRGCDAKMASQEFDRYVLGISNRGITVTDGNETRRIDERIEDFVTDEINADQFGKTYCNRNFQKKRTWILYSGEKENDNDEINGALILDEDTNSWSIYDVAMNVLGHGQRGLDVTLDQFPNSPTALNPFNLPVTLDGAGDDTLQSYHWEAFDELFLGGDTNGFVYILDEGESDNGTAIEFSIKSAAWNPYKEQGVECELGYIDFYVDTSPASTFTVSFYKNNEDAPYKTSSTTTLQDGYEFGRLDEVSPLNPSTGGYTFKSGGHGIADGEQIYLYEIEGPAFLNGTPYEANVIDENTFEINEDFSSRGTTITAISQANAGVVSAAGHPFANGDLVVISGGQMVEVIGNAYVVANATPDTFELQGVDTTGFTAYVNGGVVFPSYIGGGIITRNPLFQGKVWRRIHAGGTGYWHQVEISQGDPETPFRLSGMLLHFRKTGSRMI